MKTQTLPAASGREPASVSVNADTMRELFDTYTQYQRALLEPGDPVRVLMMTGDVLTAVRRVVTDPGRGIRR